MPEPLDAACRAFIRERRTAVLATLSPSAQPRLVPICFVLAERAADEDARAVLYSPLDEKPKRGDVRSLARVRDIIQRPGVSLLFDRWSEDWSELAWARVRGTATLLEPEDDVEAHRRAVDALRAKYPQYRDQAIDALPMIRIEISEATSWRAGG